MSKVYIFDFGNRLKIGSSQDVSKRKRQIENMSGERVQQCFSIEADSSLERVLHKKLEAHRTIGEYFTCSYENAVCLANQLAPEFPIDEKASKSPIKFKLKVQLAIKDMTQKQLADATGIRPPTISAICTGSVKQIPVYALERICDVLECQPGDIMEFVPDGRERT